MKKQILLTVALLTTAFQSVHPFSCTLTIPDREIHHVARSSVFLLIGGASTICGATLINHGLKKDIEKRSNIEGGENRRSLFDTPAPLIRNCVIGAGQIMFGASIIWFSSQLADYIP